VTNSVLSHSANPSAEAITSPEVLNTNVVGIPRAPSSRASFERGSKSASRFFSPNFSMKGRAFSLPRASIESTRTVKRSGGSFDFNESKCGISLTQGAHHVAQKFNITILPWWSVICAFSPFSLMKNCSGTGRGGECNKIASGVGGGAAMDV
jgi:hypothetical protein